MAARPYAPMKSGTRRYPARTAITTTAPAVASAVESHNAPMISHNGRGL